MDKQTVIEDLRSVKGAVGDLKRAQERAELTESERAERLDRVEQTLSDAISTMREMEQDSRRTVLVDSDLTRAYHRAESLQSRSTRQCFAGEIQLRSHKERIGGIDMVVWGLLDDPDVRTPWQERAQVTYDEWAIARGQVGLDSHVIDTIDQVYRARLNRQLAGRMFSDSAGIGAEFIPQPTLTTVEREARVARRVAARFRRQSVSSSSQLLPYVSSTLQPYKYSSIGNDESPAKYTPSSMSTEERTIAPVGWAVRAQMDEDAVADSIIDAAGELRRQMIEAIVDGEEDAIINGDTGSHFHTGLSGMTFGGRWTNRGGSGDHGTSWVGLIARADDVSATVDNGAADSAAGFRTMLKQMDEEHCMAEGTFAILNTKKMLDVMGYAEVETYDGSGAMNAITMGAPAGLYTVPLVPSKFMSYELNASGVYDDNTKTKTAMLAVDASRFVIYERSGARIEGARDIERGTQVFVGKVREIFKSVDGATVKNVAYAYNLAQ